MSGAESVVRARGLTKSFGKIVAVRGIDARAQSISVLDPTPRPPRGPPRYPADRGASQGAGAVVRCHAAPQQRGGFTSFDDQWRLA